MTNIQFSYYELSLLSFLKESHPDKATDIAFIKSRAEIAAGAYADAFDNGFSIPLCVHRAEKALYDGLHFSKHDTIVNILWNEFADIVPYDDAKAVAIRLQPLCEELFAEYSLSDGFGFSPEYELLYTELTGLFQLKIEDDGEL